MSKYFNIFLKICFIVLISISMSLINLDLYFYMSLGRHISSCFEPISLTPAGEGKFLPSPQIYNAISIIKTNSHIYLNWFLNFLFHFINCFVFSDIPMPSLFLFNYFIFEVSWLGKLFFALFFQITFQMNLSKSYKILLKL